MDHQYLAADLFLNGSNCAQAVLTAFCDVTGLDPKLAAKLSSSFGGGRSSGFGGSGRSSGGFGGGGRSGGMGGRGRR